MKLIEITVIAFGLTIMMIAQTGNKPINTNNCSSLGATRFGQWKPLTTAPRDGTRIDMLQTYGIRPWHGVFRWQSWGGGSKAWVNTKDERRSVIEGPCLFWRPYSGTLGDTEEDQGLRPQERFQMTIGDKERHEKRRLD